jgi:small subunit ribosomal protein S23
MGRYDFRPSRVYQAATRLIETGRVQQTPPWYNSAGDIPPSQTLVRTQPIQHHEPSKRVRRKKASKFFKPQRITYEEDALRRQFYRDHPWELARPRTILETDGKDHQSHDWSSIKQDVRMIDGER